MTQQFQCFQPVKVTGEGPDAGRAGTVRGIAYTEGSGKAAREVVAVQLDGDDEPRPQALATLQAL